MNDRLRRLTGIRTVLDVLAQKTHRQKNVETVGRRSLMRIALFYGFDDLPSDRVSQNNSLPKLDLSDLSGSVQKNNK